MSNVLRIRYQDDPNDTIDWLKNHGHRALPAACPGVFATGIVFDRGPGTPVQMALVGDMLAIESDGSVSVT